MRKKAVSEVKTREEARQIAVDWQAWQSKESMSYAEANEWYGYFRALAVKFNMIREFKENGII